KKNSWPPTAFTGPTVAQAHSDVDNPFMFQGVRHFALDTPNATTANLPLNQHRLRFMEPWSGRWTTRDPIGYAGGTMNLYEALQSNLLLALDAFGLESFRQFIEDGHMDKHVQALWKRAKWYDREGTFWVLKGNRSRSPNRWGGPDHVRPTPIDQLSQEPLGHVHTHQRPEHAQGPSADKDIPEANKLGKPGVVLVRDPTNPRGFRLEFFGPGVDDPIPCASLFGNAVPGTKWTVGADGRCILEITDLEQMEEYYEERDRRREEYKRDREPDSYEKFYGGKTRPREPDSIEKRDRKRAQQCQRSS
ncbi:MAG: hypothetical protein HUU46_25335, partial [Candidatus Hydrogenedentes bacterium]|nr:hypothetical protein [Candidatus Hydrogenedentota bacterium]